jgi:hypothetical protein
LLTAQAAQACAVLFEPHVRGANPASQKDTTTKGEPPQLAEQRGFVMKLA